MDTLKDILENTWVQRGLWSLVVVLFSGLIYRLIAKFLDAKEQSNTKMFSQKKNKTFIRILKSAIGYFLGTVTILMVLQIYGVNVTSMLAGVGIAGIVIGFALQDALKDIFRGFEIISDGYYEIGDTITFGNNTGQVISISLRTTKIHDVNTDNIVSIANRNIDEVEVVSDTIYLNIPLPYDVPVEKAEKLLELAIKSVKKQDNVKDAKLLGLNRLDESSMAYLVLVNCDPAIKLPTRRTALRTIVTTLEENKISIPYPQLDVHSKK